MHSMCIFRRQGERTCTHRVLSDAKGRERALTVYFPTLRRENLHSPCTFRRQEERTCTHRVLSDAKGREPAITVYFPTLRGENLQSPCIFRRQEERTCTHRVLSDSKGRERALTVYFPTLRGENLHSAVLPVQTTEVGVSPEGPCTLTFTLLLSTPFSTDVMKNRDWKIDTPCMHFLQT